MVMAGVVMFLGREIDPMPKDPCGTGYIYHTFMVDLYGKLVGIYIYIQYI